jgi:CRISPR/Cas system-associated protein endoribonuclease Cas2
MNYTKDILDKLRDSDNWPDMERPDFLQELNDIADNSFDKKTIEGYLAALLIYHQLCEEFTKLLIKYSTFYMQLSVFPQELKEKDLNGKMFGELIKILEHLPLDDNTKLYITKCKELNDLRIKMVHKLTLKTSITDISKQCKKVKLIFNQLFELFNEIYDNYRLTFKDYKKDIEDLEELI